MAKLNVQNKGIYTLDSNIPDLTRIEDTLDLQGIALTEQLLASRKILQQQRITNVYKAHENDFTVDESQYDTHA